MAASAAVSADNMCVHVLHPVLPPPPILRVNGSSTARCGHWATKVGPEVGPEVGPTSAFCSCIPTGMHEPTCIFWANLTPFSLKLMLNHKPGETTVLPSVRLRLSLLSTKHYHFSA